MVIISPTFLAGGTGASTYYGLLASELQRRDVDVTVISARHAGPTPAGYIGAFGFQTDVSANRWVQLRRYLRKNIDYLGLPYLLGRYGASPVLVHANFFTRPSLFPQLMRVAQRRQPERRFVVDVRDPHLPARRAHYLRSFTHIIACSESVVQHLERCGIDRDAVVHIPIPQAAIPAPAKHDNPYRQHSARPYIFFGGAISRYKAVDTLLTTFLEHVRPQRPDVDLVLAGPLKTTEPALLAQLRTPGVVYLGSRPHAEVLALTADAALYVHLSPNEGMPRSCLEALSLQTPILLPPSVPEFMHYCPDFVAQTPEPAQIAKQILALLEDPVVAPYPVTRHRPEQVLPAYLDVLGLR